jgi:hypothetical protein
MAKSAAKYISALEQLNRKIRDAITHKWMPSTPNDDNPQETWKPIIPIVAEVEKLAIELELPPAASFDGISGQNTPKGFEIPAGDDWRLFSVLLRNPVLDPFVLPIRLEQLKDGKWTTKAYWSFKLAPGQPSQVEWFIGEWIIDLKNPPGKSGIRDTVGGDCPWDTHVGREIQKAIARLRFSFGCENTEPVPAERREAFDREAKTIFDRMYGSKITLRYLLGMIDAYMVKLNFILDGERENIPAIPAQLRNISTSVREILTEALPLQISDQPDFPTSPELEPREALSLLGNLRKCVIRRMEPANPPAHRAREHGEEIKVVIDQEGPIRPNSFRWKGKTTELEPKPWNLLNYVWNKPGKVCTQDDAWDAVWDKEENTKSEAIRAAVRRINEAFVEVNYEQSFSQKNNCFEIS